MLRILEAPRRGADGWTRREVLTAGGLGVGGLTLAGLLRAEEARGRGARRRSVINIHLDGGPPHMDMIDPKPDAPKEIRGEFRPLATRVDGLQVTELLPKVASIADRFVFIRSLVGAASAHDAFQCQAGFPAKDLAAIGGRPALGSIVARLEGSPDDVSPPFVDLMQGRPLVRDSARPGFLGPSFVPFRPDLSATFSRPLETGMKKELAALGANHTTSLTLDGDLTSARLEKRGRLLAGLDRMRRDLDASGQMEALDRFTQQAVSILTSGRLAEALDLASVPERELEHYTMPGGVTRSVFPTSETAAATRKLLLARRLIEAGVRCVSVSFSDFDTHSKNFVRMRELVPIVDFALHALITDLETRGLLDEVTIVVWGEFGRTPKINGNAGGRDHWPQVGMALLAGGGLRTGQVVGATDRLAAEATERPVTYQDVFATLYHTLGIDPHRTTVADPSGRPRYLLDEGEALPEVI